MITIQTQSDGVLFNFQDSTRYLYGDGSILTPYNSLTLIADESNVLTFRKSASNDIFITAGYDELGYSSKEEAINDLKTKLFKATGGGSESGITPSEVQEMIDESVSGKADTATVNQIANEATQAILSISGDVQTNAANIGDIWDTIDEKEEVIASALTQLNQDVAEIDAKEEVIASALTEVRQDVNTLSGDVNTLSGDVQTKVATSDFNTYTAATATALGNKYDKVSGLTIQYNSDGQTPEVVIEFEDEELGAISNIFNKWGVGLFSEDVETGHQKSAYMNPNGTMGVYEQTQGQEGDEDEGMIYYKGVNLYPDCLEINDATEGDDYYKGENVRITKDAITMYKTVNNEGVEEIISSIIINNHSDDNTYIRLTDPNENGVGFNPSMLSWQNSEDGDDIEWSNIATKTYVDAAVSDKADTSAVTAVANDVQTVSGQVATKVATSDFNTYTAATATALSGKQDKLVYYSENTEDGNAYIIITNDDGQGNVDEYALNVGAGNVDFGHYNQYDDGQGNSGFTSTSIMLNNPEINIYAESEENGTTESTYFDITPLGVTINNENVATEPYVDAALSGKADTSAVTAVNNALTAHTSDTGIHVSAQEKNAWNAKAEPYSAGTGIEISGNVISATGGGGATYSAGTNISIDTANTINCTLPIEKLSLTSNQEENYKCLWIKPSNIKIWINENTPTISHLHYLRPAFSFGLNTIKGNGHPAAFGQMNNVNGFDSFATGDYNNTNNNYEFATGAYNNSVTGATASGRTLFSVGNGTSSARHNAFEIRQNGDIYVNDGTNDVKLQDTITATTANTTALGGLKLVKISQSDYDQLATKDPDTLYIISNVVS